MDKKQTHGVQDEDLFRQETRDVVPLKATPKADPRAPRKTTHSRQQQSVTPTKHPVSASQGVMAERSDSQETSSYRRNGVQARLLQKLKRGRFPPADHLDLHHETAASAHAMLREFIADAQSRQLQCIRIIHGKGLRSATAPVLKHMVHQALREHAAVLAFTTCKPADGGSGAVDVLLRTA